MKEKFKEYSIITFGFILVSIAIQYFFVPLKITAGGVTGIAMIINNFVPSLSVGTLMIILNVILFVVGFLIIGDDFGGKTLYAGLGVSIATWFIGRFLHPFALTNDYLLAAILGTLLLGCGLGITFSQNASTGGTDIIAKIVNKYFHFDMGKCMQLVDFLVVIGVAVAFGLSNGLYAILCVLLNGIVIDKVMDGFTSVKLVCVFAKNTEPIKKFIVEEIDRGCTIFDGTGGYSDAHSSMIYSVMGRRESIRLRMYLKENHKEAFIILQDAKEVLGEGFKDLN